MTQLSTSYLGNNSKMIIHPEDTVRFTNNMAMNDLGNDNLSAKYGTLDPVKYSSPAVCSRPAIAAISLLVLIILGLLIATIYLGVTNSDKSDKLLKYEEQKQMMSKPTATSQTITITGSNGSATQPAANTVTGSNGSTTQPAAKEVLARLPKDFRPLNYILILKSFIPGPELKIPDQQEFRTEGNLTIIIECFRDSSKLIINSAGINVTKGTVRIVEHQDDGSGTVPQGPNPGDISLSKTGGITYDGESETITFQFTKALEKGKTYSLNFQYVSLVGSKQKGYYRSSFKDPDGKKRWLAVTQFEVADARRALPCFDEPSFKAVFTITLIHPQGFIAIGNGKEIYRNKDIGDGWLETALEPSPKMSSYLLAFCVAPFESVDTQTRKGVKFRAWSRPEMKKYLNYSAYAGPKVMEFFEGYFKITFPLEKMDQVAVPDFTSGAMENFGMITYRESALLYDKTINTLRQKQWTAIVVAHEMSHQWFGNLVTMKWWDDLWLNEGFATYMEHLGADHIDDGKLRMYDQFAFTMHDAMSLDQLKTTHPLSVPVPTIKDADQMFDPISYSKGASILQMLNFTIGEDLFKRGVNHYLETLKYQNADHDDLWKAFSHVVANDSHVKSWNDGASFDTKEFMDRWTLQAGVPVITVTRNYSKSSAGNIFYVKQDRFTLNTTLDGKFSTHGFNYTWHIPIWHTTEGSSDVSMTWFPAYNTEQEIKAPTQTDSTSKWLLVNPGLRGYYRVNYDKDNWKLLQEAIIKDYTIFDVRSRTMLMEDLFNLARTGHVDYATVFKFVEYLPKEKNYIPWPSAVYPFQLMRRLLLDKPGYGIIRNFLVKLYGNKFNEFGWNAIGLNSENVLDMKLFKMIVGQACDVDVNECVGNAMEEFKKFQSSCDSKASECDNKINTELRDAVYCTAVRHGNETTWKYFLARYKSESTQAEKTRYLKALACTEQPWLRNSLLNLAMSESEMRVNDGVTVLRSISYRPGGAAKLYDFMVKQWDAIKDRFFISSSTMKRLLLSATRGFNSDTDLAKLKTLMAKYPDLVREQKTVWNTVVSEVQVNVNWVKHYERPVIEAIKNAQI